MGGRWGTGGGEVFLGGGGLVGWLIDRWYIRVLCLLGGGRGRVGGRRRRGWGQGRGGFIFEVVRVAMVKSVHDNPACPPCLPFGRWREHLDVSFGRGGRVGEEGRVGRDGEKMGRERGAERGRGDGCREG